MAIQVRLFAAFAEYANTRELQIPYENGLRCADVWQRLLQTYPAISKIPPLFAVDDEYVPADAELKDNSTLLLFPPVSGGDHVQFIFDEPLSVARAIERIQHPDGGGEAIFSGRVRRHSSGRTIRFLYYDTHRTMAEREIARIVSEMFARWPLKGVDVQHRVGKLNVGDIAVIVAVSAEHRAEAMEACRYGIDELKRRAPIWKKEVSETGEEWV